MQHGTTRVALYVTQGPAVVPLPRLHVGADAADVLVVLLAALAARAGIPCAVEGRTRHAGPG